MTYVGRSTVESPYDASHVVCVHMRVEALIFGRGQLYVIGMYTRTYIHTYVCIHIRTYIRTYIHTYVHTYIPVPPDPSTAAVCPPPPAYPQVPSHVPVGSCLHGAVPALHHQRMYSARVDEPQCGDNDVCRSPLL